MSIVSIAAVSTEYVRAAISATEAGVAVDPTSYPFEVAFTAPGAEPTNDDWNPATWEITSNTYYVRTLVGPQGGTHLPPGAHQLWVRVHADPELPTKNAGQVYIY